MNLYPFKGLFDNSLPLPEQLRTARASHSCYQASSRVFTGLPVISEMVVSREELALLMRPVSQPERTRRLHLNHRRRRTAVRHEDRCDRDPGIVRDA